MTLKDLYHASPFGMVSSFFWNHTISFVHSFSSLCNINEFYYFRNINCNISLAISGSVAQFPVGKISDMYDRRRVIIFSTFASSIFAILSIMVSGQMYLPDGLATSKTWFYIFFIFFSFCSLPMFSLILAHTNDYIPKEKFVAAGAGLQFLFGLGAMSGPFLCSIFMDLVGSNGFFIFLAFFHSIIGFFGIYRMKIRKTVDNPGLPICRYASNNYTSWY